MTTAHAHDNRPHMARRLALSLRQLGESSTDCRRQLTHWGYSPEHIDQAMAFAFGQTELPFIPRREEPTVNDDLVKQHCTNDTDAHTVTVAVTIRYNPEWSQDRCEVSGLLGALFGNLGNVIDDYQLGAKHGGKVEGFEYRCWDPDEESMLGYLADYDHAVCNGCGQPAVACDLTLNRNGWTHRSLSQCDFLDGDGDEQGRMVTFPNRLTFSFK